MNDSYLATTPGGNTPAAQPEAESIPPQANADVTAQPEPAAALESTTTEPPAVPPAMLARGIALSLLVIPLGAVAWVVLWNMGFIASIVSFGIAAGAVALYRAGSKHPVTRTAFLAVIVVILAAVIVSFFSGLAADTATFLKMDAATAAASEEFWATYWLNILDNPELWESYAPDIGMTLLFTALGCFSVIRSMARETRAGVATSGE